MSEKQRTIQEEINLPEGIGLHTGKKVRVSFKPASVNEGIKFIRTDLPGKPQIPAKVEFVIDAAKRSRRTSIGIGPAEVNTIEHVMAAFFGLKVDNIIIELNGEEMPGYDGSALIFFNAIKAAGVVEQEATKKIFQVKEPIWVEDADNLLLVLPDANFRVSYILNYDNSILNSQYGSWVFNNEVFEKEIAPSRTFCLESEIEYLRSLGLGKGADYENTLVINKEGVSVKNKLRFENELVRHKISDLLGDLYLLGSAIQGHVIAIKSGHPLNIKLLQKIKTQFERGKEAGISAKTEILATPPLDINAIQKILPHRYPFLLVDRIVELKQDEYATGIKNVTINEQFFNGHFPGHPVMPGVLILEAMAQVAGVLMLSKSDNLGKIAYFMSMDKVKFRKTVVPGDQLVIKVKVLKVRSRVLQIQGAAYINDKVAAEAELMFALGEA